MLSRELESHLVRNQGRGQLAGDGLGEALASMSENSNNDVASRVEDGLGGRTGVTSPRHRLGRSANILGVGDRWGLPPTIAADVPAEPAGE